MRFKSTANVWFSFILSLLKIKLIAKDKRRALHSQAERRDRGTGSPSHISDAHLGTLGAALLGPQGDRGALFPRQTSFVTDLCRSAQFRMSLRCLGS